MISNLGKKNSPNRTQFPVKIGSDKSAPGEDSRDGNPLTVTPLKNGVQILPRRKSGSSLVPGPVFQRGVLENRRDNPGFRLPPE